MKRYATRSGGLREALVTGFAAKGVAYANLRNGLVPQRDRLEIGPLFDSTRVDSGWYGYEVANRLIPLLPRDLLCAILSGNLLIDDQDLGCDLVERHAVAPRPAELSHASQLYCVYV